MSGQTPSRLLPLYITPSESDVRRVRPNGPRVTGFYSAGVGEVFALLSIDGGEDRGRQVLFHEYTHHFMLRNAPAAYPAWLVEGYAEYFAPTRFTPDAVELGVTSYRIAWLRGAVWSPFKDILGRRALTGEQEDITAFYAQSWLLTHYMMSDPARQARLARYASAVAAGGVTPNGRPNCSTALRSVTACRQPTAGASKARSADTLSSSALSTRSGVRASTNARSEPR